MSKTESNTNQTSISFKQVVDFVRDLYRKPEGFIPLHVPQFRGNEKEYVLDCIDSASVSSVGQYLDRFEEMMKAITGAQFAVATLNSTSALHIYLVLPGVEQNDIVITQPLSFVATGNAIAYIKATTAFVDVSEDALGMSPAALAAFLEKYAVKGADTYSYHKITGQRIKAVVPMHTFGHPDRIDEIAEICLRYNIDLVEDAAESIGSIYKGKHTGTFGKSGAFSFNGNKTVTAGGGGAIVTNDPDLAKRAKHISTTASIPHPWLYAHDEIGYNYRMPNLNAALICAQLEQLDAIIASKRIVAQAYRKFFERTGAGIFINEPQNFFSNYWLNAILLPDYETREEFLVYTNQAGVMTRPCRGLLNRQPMFSNGLCEAMPVAENLEPRLVNLPSSAI